MSLVLCVLPFVRPQKVVKIESMFVNIVWLGCALCFPEWALDWTWQISVNVLDQVLPFMRSQKVFKIEPAIFSVNILGLGPTFCSTSRSGQTQPPITIFVFNLLCDPALILDWTCNVSVCILGLKFLPFVRP